MQPARNAAYESASQCGRSQRVDRRTSNQHQKGFTMTSTIVHLRRAWVPALNMLLALAAVVIAVIALAIAPSEVNKAVTQSPVAEVDVPNPPADPNINYRMIDGCFRSRGVYPC